ncbi:flavin reductase family protein [Segatella copri]|uniref:flavin reductase family protein n=1 Tax=Segatella copri TaxID=165179 RepID=UPI00222EECFD|nr:flavin reductase [Segatella copri]MCW4086364.1 flavin reductase [Segatella copri]MCW4158162.1 flavin reductase [Segatella copri]
MKKIFIAMFMAFCSLGISAQTENGFKEIEVQDSFYVNPFTFFQNGLILAAGDQESYNAMTIGWGSMGTIWGRSLPLMTVYVAQKRYTHEFMEKSKYFTVMQFSDADVIQYMGKHSGRDGDKAKALSLHVAYTKNGTPYFKEADVVIECETMYSAPFEEKHFRNDVPKKMYANFPAGIHTMYLGQIVGAWKNARNMVSAQQVRRNR